MTTLLSSFLIFGLPINSQGQSILSQWRKNILQPQDSLSVGFRFVPPFDSLSQKGVWISVLFHTPNKPVFLFLSISGALIAFEDSLGLKPIRVEKIRYFPFQKCLPGEQYYIHVSRNSGPHGFLRAWWTSGINGRLLDEIFICLPTCFSAAQTLNCYPDKGISIKNAP